MSLARAIRKVCVFLGTPRGQVTASLLWVLAGCGIVVLLGVLISRSGSFSWTAVLGLAVPLGLAVVWLFVILSVPFTEHDCGRWLVALRGSMERSAQAMAGLAGVSVTAGLVGYGLFFAVLNRQGWEALAEVGGLLDDFWGPIMFMEATVMAGVLALASCVLYLWLPLRNLKTAAGVVAASATLVLPVLIGLATMSLVKALDLLVQSTAQS